MADHHNTIDGGGHQTNAKSGSQPEQYPSLRVFLLSSLVVVSAVVSLLAGIAFFLPAKPISPIFLAILLIIIGVLFVIIIWQREWLRRLIIKSSLDHEYNTKYLYDVSSAVFGVQKNKYHVESVLGKDGSSTARVTMEIHNYSLNALTHIDYNYTMFDHPDPQAGKNVQFQKLVCTGRDRKVDVIYNAIDVSGRQCRGTFQFIPPIRKGRTVHLEFSRMSPPNTFKMNVPRGLEDYEEYSSVEISHPMDELTIRVVFPELNCNPAKCWDGVAYGKSKQVEHQIEEARLKEINAFKMDCDGSRPFAELIVPYPIIGLNYYIMWHPPTEGAIIGSSISPPTPSGK